MKAMIVLSSTFPDLEALRKLRPIVTLRHDEAFPSSFLIDTNNFSKKSLKIWQKVLPSEAC